MADVVPGKDESEITDIVLNGRGTMPAVISDPTDAGNVAAYVIQEWGD